MSDPDRGSGAIVAGGPPVLVVPELGDDPNAAEVLRSSLLSAAIELVGADEDLRLGEDPESVHRARVAIRRLRSDLRTWRDLLDPAWGSRLREELGWLSEALGAVRDADVLTDRLRAAAASLSEEDAVAVERLLARLRERRRHAHDELLTRMRSDRYARLFDRLVGQVADPAVLPASGSPAKEVAGALMIAPYGHVRAALDDLGPAAPDEDLHGARIRVKRARYAAESLVPVFGKSARRFAAAAAELQEVLGVHQDAVIATAWLREVGTGAQAPTAFVAGELASIEETVAREARAAWPAAWKRLSRKRMRFWT
ncbi:MAG: CHAD domain-containing protein [Actinomycetota bacterium]